ncbi:unnamed protein product [Albugo candida]|uniref:UDP-N-acetylglucosamine diphosphorylase n=1 Tax=Albugo candida TaxID=65357 RepID=A0A024GBI2_9STRA|nr:unnamed protein product [Albugo candida]|eukprot:CCI44128.1 unnamed protein product [Albugo candida]
MYEYVDNDTPAFTENRLADPLVVTKLDQIGRKHVSRLLKWAHEQDMEMAAEATDQKQHPIKSNIKLLQESENFRLYEFLDERDDLFVMKGVLLHQNSNCDQVMSLISMSEEGELYEVMNDLFGTCFVDSRLLHSFHQDSIRHAREESSQGHSHIGALPNIILHWLAYKDSDDHHSIRDYVFMRYNRLFQPEHADDVTPSLYGVSVWQSLPLKTCKKIPRTSRMKRETFNNCGFVVEDCADLVNTTRITFFVTSPQHATNLNQHNKKWLIQTASAVRQLPNALINYRSVVHITVLFVVSIIVVYVDCLFAPSVHVFEEIEHGKKNNRLEYVCARLVSVVTTSWEAELEWDEIMAVSTKNSSNREHSPLSADASYDGSFADTVDSAYDEDDVRESTPCTYSIEYKKKNAWPDAPIPDNEEQRLRFLDDLSMKMIRRNQFDALLEMSRTSVTCPVAAVSIILSNTSYIITSTGLEGNQVPRDISIDAHAIMSPEPLVFLSTDTDPRTRNNPLILSLNIKFFISIPLITKDDLIIGALSLGDTVSRSQIKNLDLDQLESIFKKSMSSGPSQFDSAFIEPLDCVDRLTDTPSEKKRGWESLGLDAIHKGQLAAVILAGGQGTRLGFDGPKGIFSIGLQSKKSLFQLFAERILALETLTDEKYGRTKASKIPLLIMTSALNHDHTVSYFRRYRFFGLEEEDVYFFSQGTLPCFTLDGKLILENTHILAKASDGNGGFYRALDESGKLALLQARGVEYLHVVSVDNALCKIADPVFIGYCISKDADCGNKVVWKTRSDEKVGIVAKSNSRFCVIEYSEMDNNISQLRDESGSLRFGAGNICNHFFTINFIVHRVLKEIKLDYHVAHKKIPMADDDGCTFTPDKNSGIKLEAFIFDTFPLSERMAVLAVPREQEFAPVKNQPGAERDSPNIAGAMLSCEAKNWLLNCSQEILTDKQSSEFETYLNEIDEFEISPLLSYNGEGLNETVHRLYDQFSIHGLGSRSLRLERE